MDKALNWVAVAKVEDVPVQGSRRVMSAQGEIAIFRTGKNEIKALKNQCPHKKGPLSEGIVHGDYVTCPLHNWVISLDTGEVKGPDHGCTPVIPVDVREDTIYLALSSSQAVTAAE